MTGIPKLQQDKDHAEIDKAIEESMKESPDPVNEIAKKTGQNPMKVRRRFLALGWRHEGGRWVYRHNEGKAE